MASHFSDFGFEVTESNYHEFLDSIIHKNNYVKRVNYNKRSYVVSVFNNTNEIWLPLVNEELLSEPALHISGASPLIVDNCIRLKGNEYNSLDSIEARLFPLIIDNPTAAFNSKFIKNAKYIAQIGALPHQIEIYKTIEDFHKKNPKLNDRSFIPAGAFPKNPQAIGIISGYIRNLKLVKNPISGKEFYSFIIDTIEFEAACSADKSLFNIEPKNGYIVFGEFWMTGKLFKAFEGHQFGNLKRIDNKKDSKIKTINDLFEYLMKAYSKDTAHLACQSSWVKSDPTYGQCAIVSMIVNKMFGGDIRKLKFEDGNTHYFNFINGHTYDLTSMQFDLYNIELDYSKFIKVDASYCGKNQNTMERYNKLVHNLEKVVGAK